MNEVEQTGNQVDPKAAIFQAGITRGFVSQISDLSLKVAELSGNLEVMGSEYKDLQIKHMALQKEHADLVAKHTTPADKTDAVKEEKQNGAVV